MKIPRLSSKSVTLSNGLTVVVSEEHTVPVVAIAVTYRVGSRHEKKGRSGFAHLFEHLMFQGSENVPRGLFSRLIQAHGGVDNAFTERDYTHYYSFLPSHQVELGLWMEADRMRSLIVTPEKVENEKKVVQEELRLRYYNQPYVRAITETLNTAAFRKWPNQHSVGGSLEDVGRARFSEVVEFFNTHYLPNNAVLTVAGDVRFPEIKRLVQRHFSSIAGRKLPAAPKLQEASPSREKRAQVEDHHAKLPALVVGWPCPDRRSPDFWALSFLGELLFSGEESPLHQSLVKEKQVAISLAGQLGFPYSTVLDYKSPGLFGLYIIYPERDGKDGVLREMENVLERIRSRGISLKEWRRVQTSIRSQLVHQAQSAMDRARLLGVYTAIFGRPELINEDIKRLVSVRPEAVRRAAQKYLKTARRVVVDVIPSRKPGRAGGAQAPGHNGAVQSARPAESPAALPGVPVRAASPRALQFPGMREFRLANGLEVLCVEDHRLPLVHALLAVPAGLGFSPESLPGFPEAAAELVLQGSRNKSAKEIAEHLADMGASLSVDVGADRALLSGSVLSESALPFFRQMVETLVDADFPKDEVALWKKNELQERKNQIADPSYLLKDRLRADLFAGHPYRICAPSCKIIERVEADNLRDFYGRRYRPSESLLVIVGDVRWRELKSSLAEEFSRWPAGSPEGGLGPASAAAGMGLSLVHRPHSSQVNLAVAQSLSLSRLDADYFAFMVMNQILGGGANSRLFENLREKRGYAYDARSGAKFMKAGAYWTAQTQVNPGVAGDAAREILREIRRIQEEKVHERELAETKDFLAGSFAIRLETQDRIAAALYGSKFFGLDPLAELRDYARRVQAVAAEDVQRAARKYLRPEASRIVAVGDKKAIASSLESLKIPIRHYDGVEEP